MLLGRWRNGAGSTWWDWDVSEVPDCHVPSNCGPYLTAFNQILYYRCGSSDCGGGSGSWNDAVCFENAIIRYAWAGKSTDFANTLSSCYWMEKSGCPEYCYLDLNTKIYELDIYCVLIENDCPDPDHPDKTFGHEVCAEYNDNTGSGSKKDWGNWTFFQYDNPDIQIGNWQMPKGSDVCDTKVIIYKVIGIRSCDTYEPSDVIVTFLIDKNGDVTVG
ncbi:hypothetical protein J2128_000631 [Methanomicrobium sp. W14]|uniref:hypothetical protein n=1 Tax=Methanomicrobium sp. W14 TaxID=2817839 RepID=UPI001AE97D03|nr:hypothetical protein [Methanomicrobium sp. W14]MBP2132710.1 hypothetical protein [Methanomicrobium sp. W14]